MARNRPDCGGHYGDMYIDCPVVEGGKNFGGQFYEPRFVLLGTFGSASITCETAQNSNSGE